MTVPAPLFSWDARAADWFRGPFTLRAAWLQSHGLPSHKMHRAEFYLVDAPYVRVFCYALNAEGRRYWADGHTREPHDHSGCGPAYEEPFDVLLEDLPPEELR